MGNTSKNAVRVLAVYEMLLSAAEPLSTKTIINNLERDYNIKADKKTIYRDISAIKKFFPVEYIRPQGYCSVYFRKKEINEDDK